MNVITPRSYDATRWWETLGEGVAGQTPRTWASPEKLEAIIAARRASCSARMKQLRAHSERRIAKLISNGGR
jgi:hypothetical protein